MSELIERLVDAYNRKDLDAFVRCYAHDAEIYRLGDNDPILHGAAKVREAYAAAFEAEPGLRAIVESRIELGNVVVNRERIERQAGRKPLEAVVIYKIEKGLIAQSWYAEAPA